MAELGCGRVGAALVAREAPYTILRDLSQDVLSASANRRLNDISEARIALASCYDGPAPIPWVHGLLLTWDAQFLWYGPITNVADDPDGGGTIAAKDLMAWMQHRKVRDDFTSVGAPVDVSTIFQSILDDGFVQDATVAYTISPTPTGITAERTVTAAEQVYVYDTLSELSVTGIDWSVVLQTIRCGNVEISTTPIGVLNEAHFVVKPTLELSGEEQTNFATVAGTGAVVGLQQDAASQVTYGLLDLIEHESGILDNTSAAAAALTRLTLRKNSPLLIGALTLREFAPLALADLIPGAVVTVSIDGAFVSYAGGVRLETAEFEGVDGRWQATLNGQPIGTT